MIVAPDGVTRSWPARRRAGGPASTPQGLLVLATLSAACSGTPQLAVVGAEARLSPVLLGTCSIFMRIENAGDGDDALLGASVGIPGAVAELHGTRDGRMVKQDRVRIPARGAVALEPKGLHVMVFGLPRDARPGFEFTLRLAFEKTGERVAAVRIAG